MFFSYLKFYFTVIKKSMLCFRFFFVSLFYNQAKRSNPNNNNNNNKKWAKIIYKHQNFQSSQSAQIRLFLYFMEIKCQNWLTGFQQSLSSDLALRLLTFIQRWRQTVFGDWCNIASGARATANQCFYKIAGTLNRISSCECVIRRENRIINGS